MITLRIAHLRIAHWGAIPRWAILSPSVIRIAHPNYYVFLWIVCARYGPWVNAGDYASVFNHNILKNKVIHAITGDIWKRSVERSQTNVPNETLQAIWELVWKHTVKKKQTNANSVILYLIRQEIWGDIWKHTVEKSQTNVTSVITHLHPLVHIIWGLIWEHRRS